MKQKNDDLQDNVLYINQGNIAYVRGETKDLANKAEVFRNIAWSAGSSTEPNPIPRLIIVSILLFGGICSICTGSAMGYAIFSPSTQEPSNDSLFLILFLIAVVLLTISVGIWLIYVGIRNAIYRPEKIRALYTELTQYGQTCSGYIIRLAREGLHYSFTTPAGKRINGIYHTNVTVRSQVVQAGQPIVVLYLNDKIHILL